MLIKRWTPEQTIADFDKEINKFLSDFGIDKKQPETKFKDSIWSPRADIIEEKENYTLQIDLPGIEPDQVKISFKDDKLSISGERKAEEKTEEKNFHRIERSYGKFFRAFELPEMIQAEKISANFKNGLLLVTIPKIEEVKPKEIEIKVS